MQKIRLKTKTGIQERKIKLLHIKKEEAITSSFLIGINVTDTKSCALYFAGTQAACADMHLAVAAVYLAGNGLNV